jgi:hypothetical protein
MVGDVHIYLSRNSEDQVLILQEGWMELKVVIGVRVFIDGLEGVDQRVHQVVEADTAGMHPIRQLAPRRVKTGETFFILRRDLETEIPAAWIVSQVDTT